MRGGCFSLSRYDSHDDTSKRLTKLKTFRRVAISRKRSDILRRPPSASFPWPPPARERFPRGSIPRRTFPRSSLFERFPRCGGVERFQRRCISRDGGTFCVPAEQMPPRGNVLATAKPFTFCLKVSTSRHGHFRRNVSTSPHSAKRFPR